MTLGYLRQGIPAPFALPVGFAAFLAVGTVEAAPHGHAAVIIAVTAIACAGLGLGFRWYLRRLTLVSMGMYTGVRPQRLPATQEPAEGAISVRRRLAGVLLAAVSLPLLTYVLTFFRPHLNLADDVLAYLVAVVTITVLGGFWPAVLAAVVSSLLLNW